MSWMLLLAQLPTDVPAISGWSAFGLTGLILSWLLLKHLPDKDKIIHDLITEHNSITKDRQDRSDKSSADTLAAFNMHAREVREDFKANLSQVLSHCETEIQGVMTMIHKDMDALRSAIELLARSERVRDEPHTAKRE